MKRALIVTLTPGFCRHFLENDVIALQERGYEIHNASEAKIDEVDLDFLEKYDIKHHAVSFSGRKPLNRKNWDAFLILRKIVKEGSYDVIHCHTPVVAVLTKFASFLSPKKGRKLIYTSHGFFFHKYAPRKTWVIYYPIEWLTSVLCNGIITINQEDFRTAKTMLCKKVFHINGVGLERAKYMDVQIDRNVYRESLGVEEDAFVILVVGQVNPNKNHSVLIRALAKAQIPNAVLMVCGKGQPGFDSEKMLQDLSKKLGVKLIMLGHRTDVPQLIQCADIGAFPSKKEGLGMAALEMLTGGLPLVTSDVQGIKDYMRNGVNGFMVPPTDVDGFAQAIIKLYDPDLRDKMRRECVCSTEEFDKSVNLNQMREIYDQLLS